MLASRTGNAGRSTKYREPGSCAPAPVYRVWQPLLSKRVRWTAPRHSRETCAKRDEALSLKDGKFILSDMHSTNGVYVNGRQVSAPMVIIGPNTIHIAVFLLSVSLVRVQ